ncbi:MAG: amino acid-binding protein [Eubacteriaceae bacterium]|nr:amino acid-binding protein [Eubacteriaceae bacterium]
MAKQLSIFVGDSQARLNQLLKLLYEDGINIVSLAIADTGEFGITRLIVDDIDKAAVVIEEGGLAFSITDVIAILVANEPGTLYKTTKLLTDNGVHIEYAYSALPDYKSQKAILIIKVDYHDLAIKLLEESDHVEMIENL